MLLILTCSFIDLSDYWTLKYNGKTVFNSSESKSDKIFNYKISKNKITIKDSLTIQYIVDYEIGTVSTFFVNETNMGNNTNRLMVYKSIDHNPYKISVQDLYNAGLKGSSKQIMYCENGWIKAKELCRVSFN